VPYEAPDRILAAVAAVVRQKGYPAMTVEDIVRGASISFSTFYVHFSSKEEALLAAFDSVQAHTIAATMPAFNRAPDWPHAVRAGLHALFAYNAVESDGAYLGNVGMYAAGLRALERRDSSLETFQAALAPGYEERPEAPPIAAEAIGGAIYALIYDHVLRRGPETLSELGPTATFIALAPFIGVDAACEVANEPTAARRPAMTPQSGGL
jgi:AcrR family transcriptional regulator